MLPAGKLAIFYRFLLSIYLGFIVFPMLVRQVAFSMSKLIPNETTPFPMLGVYGNDYTPCIPNVVVQLPCLATALPKQVPAPLMRELEAIGVILKAGGAPNAALNGDIYILFHTQPERSPCQKFLCENTDEVNMMYHPWLLGSQAMTDETTVSLFVLVCFAC